MRYFLTDDGNVARDTPAELPVNDIAPQIVRFHYAGVVRLVQVITIKPTASAGYPVLLLGAELWNSRDGLHDEGQAKTFKLEEIYGLSNA